MKKEDNKRKKENGDNFGDNELTKQQLTKYKKEGKKVIRDNLMIMKKKK